MYLAGLQTTLRLYFCSLHRHNSYKFQNRVLLNLFVKHCWINKLPWRDRSNATCWTLQDSTKIVLFSVSSVLQSDLITAVSVSRSVSAGHSSGSRHSEERWLWRRSVSLTEGRARSRWWTPKSRTGTDTLTSDASQTQQYDNYCYTITNGMRFALLG